MGSIIIVKILTFKTDINIFSIEGNGNGVYMCVCVCACVPVVVVVCVCVCRLRNKTGRTGPTTADGRTPKEVL